MHNEESNISYDALESAASRESNSDFNEQNERSKASNSGKSLMKNWPLMSSIIVYCIFSLHDMAYTEVHIFISDFRCQIIFLLLPTITLIR